MEKNNFFERKGDKRLFPIIDDHIAVGRLWGLFIYPIVLFSILAYATDKFGGGNNLERFFVFIFPRCSYLLVVIGYLAVSGHGIYFVT